MKQFFGVLALVFALSFAAPPSWAQTFEVGQVWSLNAPMSPEARIRVGRVEDAGQTVHISLWGQPIEEASPLGSPLVAGHLPISSDALARSVNALADETPPDLQFEEGYAEWSRAQGGVFTITVPEIVDVILQSAAHLPPPSKQNKL
ncbi:MAG: hypothetical protein K2P70_11170 [Hyphomonadaceae bacterium]|nr:hypothetical protein [Hyphomonadaceae bacterium]